jgi:Biotin synthase and related enzymes
MSLNRHSALAILNANADSLPNLIEQAYQLRTKYKGNRVSIQLLTNVRSGNCTQNCAYCAQSRDSEAPIEKYRYVEDKKTLWRQRPR